MLIGLEYIYRHYWINRSFKKIYGKDITREFHVVYPLHCEPLPPRELPHWKPVFHKLPRKNGSVVHSGVNLKQITSIASAKSIGYLVNAFGKSPKISPTISSDHDIDEKMDISFISIGGKGNIKTEDLLENLGNEFYEFRINNNVLNITNKKTGEKVVDTNDMDKCDYGVIIKINPAHNPEKTWICCAGVGLWGTSGASYYLAQKWKEILKWAGNKPFGCVIKTKVLSDDSTEIIDKIGYGVSLLKRLKNELKLMSRRLNMGFAPPE